MRKIALSLAAAALASGCVSWQPGWTESPALGGSSAPAELMAGARVLTEGADSEAKLVDSIRAWDGALERDGTNYEVLTELCQLTILHAAAYADRISEKRTIYERGIRYCERAMYTNEDFRARIEGGASLEDAAGALTLGEADAMLFWVTGVSYYFKECVRGLGKLTGFRLISRTETLLERMNELDPNYADGAVHFSRGIYYLGLPKFAGGDDAKSLELLQRAEEVGPESLLVRWGRAKYYYVETGNRAGFEEDLRWVLAQDPRTPSNPFAWNVYFQRDAEELLANAERLF